MKFLNRGINLVWGLLFLCVTHTAIAYQPNKTAENVQTKAVIIKHNAKLFSREWGYYGQKAPFMGIYFLMEPGKGKRVPVSKRPYKTGSPDGWLETNSYVEWNTLQMLKLEPQSGRKLAKIFETKYCAELFGSSASDSYGCQVLGEEPNRFTSQAKPQLLIPVFEKSKNSYQGGFIRVYENGSSINATPTNKQNTNRQLGYDIVFVIDSSTSGGKHFTATKEVLQAFIKQMQKSSQNGNMPIRIGVLFYREKTSSSCKIGYLTKWGHHLTKDLNSVSKTLDFEKEAPCSDRDNQAAVLDGLNRVIYETPWADNHFKSIILVGDAAPYAMYDRKNPMKLGVSRISYLAQRKNIRLLTFKLGENNKAFEKLALDTRASNKGRYKNIPQGTNKKMFKNNLFSAMTEEWRMLSIAQNMINASNIKKNGRALLNDPAFRQKYKISQYDALIIQARLPETRRVSKIVPEFVKGWIPEEIKNQLVVGEFIFMDKFHLNKLVNTLRSIENASFQGLQDGGMAFLSTIRNVLAAQTKLPPSKLFLSGESLSATLQKANILPFKTDILTFTAQEVNTWKPADYRRINMIVKEKVKVLGEFMSNPQNLQYLGKMPHLYVPKAFFP